MRVLYVDCYEETTDALVELTKLLGRKAKAAYSYDDALKRRRIRLKWCGVSGRVARPGGRAGIASSCENSAMRCRYSFRSRDWCRVRATSGNRRTAVSERRTGSAELPGERPADTGAHRRPRSSGSLARASSRSTLSGPVGFGTTASKSTGSHSKFCERSAIGSV